MTFAELNLAAPILKSLELSGYTDPTPVQAEAIPLVLEGHDLIASAQTGTGKTAAFMLPALQRLLKPMPFAKGAPRILVLTPTRELAQQVTEAAKKYGQGMRVKTVSVLGGMPYPVQNRMLAGQVDILVATPGRLIDHLDRGRIDFSRLEMLVLDEADRMLDMGFIDDVERIVGATPATRQTVLFSATMEGEIARLAQRILKSPKRVAMSQQSERHENIEQRLHYVDDLSHKNKVLRHVLNGAEVTQAIVFTATKRDADSLAEALHSEGHSVAALHGDMNQGARNRTLQSMRRGQVRVLVATDVAARGLDVAGISHVVNFDLPKQAEDYVHRIGRTGRAGAQGMALTLVSSRDALLLTRIERFTGNRITPHVIEGLEPRFKPSSFKANPGKKRSFSNSGYKGKSGAPGGKSGSWKPAYRKAA